MICFTNRMTKSSLDVNLAGILSIYDKKSKKFTIAENQILSYKEAEDHLSMLAGG